MLELGVGGQGPPLPNFINAFNHVKSISKNICSVPTS